MGVLLDPWAGLKVVLGWVDGDRSLGPSGGGCDVHRSLYASSTRLLLRYRGRTRRSLKDLCAFA